MKNLLAHPNPAQEGRSFIENIISFLLVAGNSYIEVSKLDETPRELIVLRPDRVRLILIASGVVFLGIAGLVWLWAQRMPEVLQLPESEEARAPAEPKA